MTALDTGGGARAVGPRVGALAAVSAVALAVLSAVLLLAGFPLAPSLAALWRGAAGSPDAFLSVTLVRAVPLLLLGSGMVLALRAGVINLGGDGQFLAGAIVGTAVTTLPGAGGLVIVVVALVLSAAAGMAWTFLPAWLKARFGTLEVVSTIMMNFVALFLTSLLVRGPLQEPTHVYPQSASIPPANHLPTILAASRLHVGIVLALLVIGMTWVFIERTAGGFRVRAVGSNPSAAELAGRIDVRRVQWSVFLASGFLGGLAGGVEVLGVTYALYENLSPGYGYTAIAVALLARLNPLDVVWSAVLLGGVSAGATAMQRDVGVPAGAAAIVEATLMLSVLGGQALVSKWMRMRSSRAATA